jgi:uncharacterized protein YabN with tetrapyrrole methylase and pyrophosphatase domain
MKRKPAINQLLAVMAKLRSPKGCPWDREQDHMTLRRHAVEEVYELIDAIEAQDDHEMAEELGDLLLQVVFHCQMAKERKAFNFEKVTQHLVDKLIRRHPHVFGQTKVKDVDEVWANWEQIKKAEKHGTKHQRNSALDGIPKHLPALLRAEKLIKKARKAKLITTPARRTRASKADTARKLFRLVSETSNNGWSAEELLMDWTRQQEKRLRSKERRSASGKGRH